jgi:Methyltransferase domain
MVNLKSVVASVARKTGIGLVNESINKFHSNHYLRHNARRLEHLASLKIPVSGMSVLEVGAGIGDHSNYYTDRNCTITITEARNENLQHLRQRYPNQTVQLLDLEKPLLDENIKFDIVHCYGLLYHMSNPGEVLDFLSEHCQGVLLLETCVSFGDDQQINLVAESQENPTQAFSGMGCRPTRSWIFEKLKENFEHVYIPLTQPNHEEFPLDWSAPQLHSPSLSRAVFVASRKEIENSSLVETLVMKQVRHE